MQVNFSGKKEAQLIDIQFVALCFVDSLKKPYFESKADFIDESMKFRCSLLFFVDEGKTAVNDF